MLIKLLSLLTGSGLGEFILYGVVTYRYTFNDSCATSSGFTCTFGNAVIGNVVAKELTKQVLNLHSI